MLKDIAKKYKECYRDRKLFLSILFGFLFFAFSLMISQEATEFATQKAGSSVQDLILSNIRVFNVDFIVNEGAMIFCLFMLAIVIFEPKRAPFILKSSAFFVLVRSVAITLTHIGQFPQRSYIDQAAIFGPLNMGADLFFSGHAGLPFLMALIFWEHKLIRTICLTASAVFAVSVLLGHLHYSIDVFAAYFITYSIFVISQKFFFKDYQVLMSVN